jgi:hypothetical protein
LRRFDSDGGMDRLDSQRSRSSSSPYKLPADPWVLRVRWRKRGMYNHSPYNEMSLNYHRYSQTLYLCTLIQLRLRPSIPSPLRQLPPTFPFPLPISRQLPISNSVSRQLRRRRRRCHDASRHSAV